MSPIKTRKQIMSPYLNNEQASILDLWATYKAGDFLSIGSKSDGKVSNLSQTPVMTQKFFTKSSPADQNEDTRSCTKISVMKAKRKRKRKVKKNKSKRSSILNLSLKNISMKNHCQESRFNPDNQSKNMMKLSKDDTSGTKSVKKRKSKKHVKFSQNHHMSFLAANNVISGLNDILNDMERNRSDDKHNPNKGSPRKMSADIAEEKYIPSPKKRLIVSPRKSPRKKVKKGPKMMSYKSTVNSPMKSMYKSPKRRTKKLRKKRKSSKRSDTQGSKPRPRLSTILDLTAIVAGLNQVLEESK